MYRATPLLICGALVAALIAGCHDASTASRPPFGSSFVLPLTVGATSRHLVDQHGKPFLVSGESAWGLFAQLTDEEAETYLRSRQQYGFTLVMISLIVHEKSSYAPANIYREPPFNGAAFTNPNEAYFARVDARIRSAAGKGMVVLLAPAYLGFQCTDDGWCGAMQSATTDQMFAWGRYVGSRYRDFDNIIWLIGGDAEPSPVVDKIQAMVDGIRSVDTRHLFTYHSFRGQMAINSWPGASWLNVNDIYTDGMDYVAAATAYAVTPTMPFFLVESLYENTGATPQGLRAESYWTVLSGGFGHVYGNCPIWHFSTPSVAGEYCDGSLRWQTQLDGQGARNMLNFRRLFESRHWSELVPDRDHTAMTDGYGEFGSADYATAALASDGSSLIAYLPSSRAVTVSGDRLAGSQMTAWWYDPLTGTASRIGTFSTTSSQTFTPPANGDWVLVVDGSKFPFPAPGDSASQ